jgi:hypothetical protein
MVGQYIDNNPRAEHKKLGHQISWLLLAEHMHHVLISGKVFILAEDYIIFKTKS